MATDPLAPLKARAAAALLPTEGTLDVPGLAERATVTRDGRGVPSIEAASLDDLWFAQGFVTAGERLAQLDLILRTANGRMSERFGERTFDADRFARLVGLHLAGATTAAAWSEEDHAMHRRFREGVAAWIQIAPVPPVEYEVLGIAPDLPDDPASWAAASAYLAWNLSGNLEQELLRARIRARLGDDAVETLLPPTSGRDGRGSNAWALSGAHTPSGRPLLANDPHLLAVHPGAWLPLRLRAPGYDVRGLATAFTPGVVLGATPHHAWGTTNVTGDVQDLVVVTDADVTGTRDEPIAVLGEATPRVLVVRETRHGPIVDRVPVGATASIFQDVDGAYALRWVGHDVGLRPSTLVRLATAEDPDAFRAAALEFTCPGQNLVYADVEGRIALQVTGRYPIRAQGDGTEPREDHGWSGWVPDADLPAVLDPPDGRIVTANDAPRGDHAAIGRDFHAPLRARRIHELLDARETHDVASFSAMQRDTVSLAARASTPLLLERVPAAKPFLDGWDHDLAADSAAAAVWEVWTEAIARRALATRMGEDLFIAYVASWEPWRCSVLPALLAEPGGWLDDALLAAALEDARTELGEPPPAWGDLHRIVLAHPFARIPGFETMFTAVDLPAGGDEATLAAAGTDGAAGRTAAVIASARLVWDLGDLDASVWTVPAGVSGNPVSPHWNDQSEAHRSGTGPVSREPGGRLTLVPGASR